MKSLCTLILSLTVICASITQAAVVGVEMRDPYYFTPTNVVINPGDRVVWTNNGIRVHDTRHMSTPALWASPNVSIVPPTNTFGFTFTNVGYYPYRCQQHLLLGPNQTGTVSVVNISLTNALRTPTNAQFEIRGPACLPSSGLQVNNRPRARRVLPARGAGPRGVLGPS